jgi:hypothetical protein
MIPMMIMKNILRRMMDVPFLQQWKPMQARVYGY